MYKNLAATVMAASVIAFPTHAQKTEALKVGFVYVAPITEAGWVRQHEEGRQAVQAAFGSRVKTSFVENVAEGPDAERVIRDLASTGHKLIFTPSFGYMEPTLRVAKDFPGVKFESITGYKTAPNVAAANARYYEGRYLAGIAAGRMTKSKVAGYVAGFPIPEVLQGINAFTLGMRSVNPQAQVKVVWLNAWFDPGRERDAAMALFDQGADVVSFHTGSTAVMAAAQGGARGADRRHHAPVGRLLPAAHAGGAGWKLEERQCVGRREGGNDPRRPLRPQGAQGGAGGGAGAAEGHRIRQAASLHGTDRGQRRPFRDRQGAVNDGRPDTGYELSRIGRAGEGRKMTASSSSRA
jgi:basic membrane protein A and related proteins